MIAQPRTSPVARRWRAVLGVVVVLVCLALLAPSALAVSFVYVTNSGSNTISGFRVGSSGSLTPVPGSPFPTGGTLPEGVAIRPVGSVGRHLYVANFTSNNVSGFNIRADGSLAPVPGSPFPAGPNPMQPVVTPDGTRVYVTNHGSPGAVSAFNINALNGSLTQIAGSPFSTIDPNAFGIAITPDGRNLYAPNENRANNADPRRVAAFSIAANGSLSHVPGSPFVTGPANSQPIGAAVSTFGTALYVAVSHGPNIAGFSIGSNGALTPLPGSPYGPVSHPTAIIATPDAARMYATSGNEGANVVTGFTIGSGGALTPIGTVATGVGPQGIGVTPGPLPLRLYASAVGSNNVSGFTVGTNGALTPISGSPFASGGTGPGVFAVAAMVQGEPAIRRTSDRLTYLAIPFRPVDPNPGRPHDLSLTAASGGVIFSDSDSEIVPGTSTGCAARSPREVICSTRRVTRLSVGLGDGGDEITVRPGIPTGVGAGPGADRIDVVNGIADTVGSCGSTDTVSADLQDNIQGTCGSLSRAAVDQFPTVRIRTRIVRISRRGIARVRLSCPRRLQRGCRGRLTLRRLRGSRKIRISSARYRRFRRSEVVSVRVSGRQLRALRRLGRTRGQAIARERDRRGDPRTSAKLVGLRARR
jgi:6-phosphogluconolactonase